MNIIDIIIILPLIYALWHGYRKGVIVQLSGIVGIIIGVYIAYRWCDDIAKFIGIKGEYASEITFTIIIIVVLILLVMLGRGLSKLVDLGGLGGINKVAGAVLSLAKVGLVVSLLLVAFDAVNLESKWVKEQTIRKSVLYQPVKSVSKFIFPYIDFASKHLEKLKNQINPETAPTNSDDNHQIIRDSVSTKTPTAIEGTFKDRELK